MAATLLFWKILTLPSPTPSRPSPIYSRGGVQFYRTSFDGPLLAKKGEQEVFLVPALFEALSAPKGEGRLPSDFFKALSPEETKALVDLAIQEEKIVAWDPEISIQLLDKTLPLEVQQALLQRYQSNNYLLGQFLILFPKMVEERSSGSSLMQLASSHQGVWQVKGLVKQMKAQQIPFSPEEQWVALAAEDDSLSFDDRELLSLSQQQREQIFYFANGLEARKLIQRLKGLRMGVSDFQYWQPMSYFAYDMDLLEAEAALLRGLQRQRCLSRAEFDQLPNRADYLQMKHNLLQVSTTETLKSVARRHQCDQIIFPQYCLVVNRPEKIQIHRQSLDCSSNYPVTIYVEKRERVERKLTLEEAVQLMTLIWQSDSADLEDIFVTSSGLYVEPTGSLRSRGATLETLQQCAGWVGEEDQAALLSEAQRIAGEPKEIEAQRGAFLESYRANPYGYPLTIVDEIELDLSQLFTKT